MRLFPVRDVGPERIDRFITGCGSRRLELSHGNSILILHGAASSGSVGCNGAGTSGSSEVYRWTHFASDSIRWPLHRDWNDRHSSTYVVDAAPLADSRRVSRGEDPRRNKTSATGQENGGMSCFYRELKLISLCQCVRVCMIPHGCEHEYVAIVSKIVVVSCSQRRRFSCISHPNAHPRK